MIMVEADAPTQHGAASHQLTPLSLHVHLEVCTAARPSTFLRGTSAAYQSAAERLQAGLQALSSSLRSTVVLSVNSKAGATSSPRKASASSFQMTNPWSGKPRDSSTPRTRRPPPPPPPSFLSSDSAVAAAYFAKEPAAANSAAPYPRVGAFEVSFRIFARDAGGQHGAVIDCGGGLLFSKLQQSRWPSTSSVIRALGERLKLATMQHASAAAALSSIAPAAVVVIYY